MLVYYKVVSFHGRGKDNSISTSLTLKRLSRASIEATYGEYYNHMIYLNNLVYFYLELVFIPSEEI